MKETLVLNCAGCANVGQLANLLALELVREGFGSPLCLCAVGAHRRGFIKAAKEKDTILIDGCSIGCGKAIFEHAEVPLKKYLCLTDLGIKKNLTGDLGPEDLENARRALRGLFAGEEPTALKGAPPSTCCG